MQYDQVRELLRGKLLDFLKKVEPDSELIANLLADKLMALEFSRKELIFFYHPKTLFSP